ncbi:Uncharacterized protein BM_BM9535 [Brugia malayi]|uniref:Bm9535 n=2 Tax=Brugia malayi TaxID=6279 RepID=A0A4E9EWL7_BRUMA|nr:Uncharacterized protein BM_BM9535 [Brugia malayi]VIO88793.1 Uncharacterized protein BM_BM9535 [Brugia malayi]
MTFLISILMIGLPIIPVLILCQFKKMEKKKKTVLSVSRFPAIENNDSDRKQTADDTTHLMEKKEPEEQNKVLNQINAPVTGKFKSVEVIHRTGTPMWVTTNHDIEHVADGSLQTQKCKDRGGRNYQIIGDLDTTDSSYEYSLENTLAMESLEMIKGKYGVKLEGEEIDHQLGKALQQSDSSDYSLFDSQSSRRDIREQRFRLLKLNTSIARRAAAALEDSAFSTSTRNKKETPAAERNEQAIQVEETKDKLIAHT